MDWLFSVLTILFIVISVALALVILLQRPQGGGLAQAFGGSSGGGTDTAFGGRTGDALTVATVAVFTMYILTAIALNIIDNPSTADAETVVPETAVIEPGLLPTEGVVIDPLPAPAAGDVPTIEGSAAPADAPAPAPADATAPVPPSEPQQAPAAEPVPAPVPAPGTL